MCIGVLFAYISLCVCVRCRIPYNKTDRQLWAATWVLGELGSTGRAASALNQLPHLKKGLEVDSIVPKSETNSSLYLSHPPNRSMSSSVL